VTPGIQVKGKGEWGGRGRGREERGGPSSKGREENEGREESGRGGRGRGVFQ